MIDGRQFIRSNFYGVYLNDGNFYASNAGQRAQLFALLYNCKFRYIPPLILYVFSSKKKKKVTFPSNSYSVIPRK